MRTLLVFGISALLVPFAVNAQRGPGRGRGDAAPLPPPPPPMAQGLECFEGLTTPDFPKSALAQHVDGTVWTVTDVSPQGTINKIDTDVVSAWSDAAKLLTPPVEKVIRAAKIKPECNGMKIAMVFRYQLYGEPTAAPRAESHTEKPDIMWIESQPEPTAHH